MTLTLDAEALAELRRLVGARSLSAAVDGAIGAELVRLKHLAAVDEWLAELDSKFGTPSTETLEWAARVVDEWARPRGRRRRAG